MPLMVLRSSSDRLEMLNKPFLASLCEPRKLDFDDLFFQYIVLPPLSSIYARGVHTDPPTPVGDLDILGTLLGTHPRHE